MLIITSFFEQLRFELSTKFTVQVSYRCMNRILPNPVFSFGHWPKFFWNVRKRFWRFGLKVNSHWRRLRRKTERWQGRGKIWMFTLRAFAERGIPKASDRENMFTSGASERENFVFDWSKQVFFQVHHFALSLIFGLIKDFECLW